MVRRVLDRAVSLGRVSPDLDLDVETERLSALLDGLAMSAVLQPDLLPVPALRRILGRHLDSLADGTADG